MSAGNIRTLRDNVADAMDALTGTGERFQGVTCEAHGGAFDTVKELDRYAKRSPAAIVAVLRANSSIFGGVPRAHPVLGIFCLTTDKPGLKRDDGALDLMDNVMDFLLRSPAPTWSLAAKTPQNVIARNLYSEALDARGIALWGVFWEQPVDLAQPVSNDEPSFDLMHIDYDLAPRANDADLGDVIDAEDDVTVTTP
jgi:hypothetical protein